MYKYSVEVDYMNHNGEYDMFAYRCDTLSEAREQFKLYESQDFNNYYARATLEVRLVDNVGKKDRVLMKNVKIWRPVGGHALSL